MMIPLLKAIEFLLKQKASHLDPSVVAEAGFHLDEVQKQSAGLVSMFSVVETAVNDYQKVADAHAEAANEPGEHRPTTGSGSAHVTLQP